MAADHDEPQVGVEAAGLPDQLEPVHLGHADVRHHDPDALFAFQHLHRLHTAGRHGERKLPLEAVPENESKVLLVIYEQHRNRLHGLPI